MIYVFSFSKTTTIASLLKSKSILRISLSIVTTLYHCSAWRFKKAENLIGFTFAAPRNRLPRIPSWYIPTLYSFIYLRGNYHKKSPSLSSLFSFIAYSIPTTRSCTHTIATAVSDNLKNVSAERSPVHIWSINIRP